MWPLQFDPEIASRNRRLSVELSVCTAERATPRCVAITWPTDVGMQNCGTICSIDGMQTTSIRVDEVTHRELKKLAEETHSTVGEAVALAVRRLRQDKMGRDLVRPISDEEIAWLDADLG